MTFQLQAFKAKGILYASAQRNITEQSVDMLITSANTDTALDISSDTTGSLGTFWTAVTTDATYGQIGTNALAVIQNIVSNCSRIREIVSEAITSRTKVTAGGSFLNFTSAVISTGTSVSATVTGLLATDVVVSVTQKIANANSVVPVAFGTPTANTLPLTYAATSGANGTVSVLVYRPSGVVVVGAGQYGLTLTGHLPSITFNSGTAPTTQILSITWLMQDGALPITADYGAAF